ncbi:formylglycine-generating enzyme family protein [Niabella hibiscisoli]|uniref:formylglycine-generating enzyme family protein n=1 Tax=Niabella hibiscisoli TaxID=1825928 RepID=UPI0021D4505C|nr:formylglycine-generating enzyme family protein [Niabella hibiscisoli]
MPASRFAAAVDSMPTVFPADSSLSPMVFIPGGTFEMGGDNEQASQDEYPKHLVQVSAFYMDVTEVTNDQFRTFVEATGYVTTAERKPDWSELQKHFHPVLPNQRTVCWLRHRLSFCNPTDL